MTSVVIVGSRFTGFECARRLARTLRKENADVDVTIVSPVDYMLYTPLLPDVAGGVVDARFVTIPLANSLPGVRAVFLLLDLAEHVMPEVGERLGDAARRVLEKRGIDVRLGITLKAVESDHVILSDDSRVDTHTVAWVTGVTGAPLVERLGLETERGRLKVQTDLQVPGHPGVYAAGDAAAAPDLTQPGEITPPTAQHATRQGKPLARNVAASLGYGTAKPYKHRNMGLVVDLGPHYAVANPLNIHLSGFPAKVVTRAYHVYAIPAVGQPLGGVTGLPDRCAARPFGGVDRTVHAGRRPVLRQ